MKLRTICRAIIYNFRTNSVLLVRGNGDNWWHFPGGEWDYARESLPECARRETLEETGLSVKISKLVFVQTIYRTHQKTFQLEHFWAARVIGTSDINPRHFDRFGDIAEARWFKQSEAKKIKIYPNISKKYWSSLTKFNDCTNPYLGENIL